jgi:hypothetical protein
MGLLSFIESISVQTAVYWTAGTRDGFGDSIFSEGVEIRCRWDDTTELIRDKHGKDYTSKAMIMIPQEDVDDAGIDEDGFLYLGTLEELEEIQQSNPLLIPKAFPIVRIDKNPLFKAVSEFVYTIYL